MDAANSLMAVKDLVFDKKKLTMAELKAALAANFEGEYEKVHKMCYQDAPKHGNDIDEVSKLVHRVNDSVLTTFNNVDGGGNYISKDIKTSLDQYTKSVHNLMGMVTGALPNGKKSRRGPHRRQPVGDAGHRRQRTDRAGDVRREGQ